MDAGAAENVIAAIDRNTRAVDRLREALCGTSTDPKPGGAIGEFVNTATSERFHGRGHSNTAGRPV